MSVLNEFIVARPTEITEDVLERGSAGRFPTEEATSLNELSMALLLVAVEGRPLDDAVERLAAFEMSDAGTDGPWLTRLPDDLRDALAGASAADLRRYATQWLEAEEMAGADVEDMTALLERLSKLAQGARAEEKSLYLWTSL